MSSWRQSIQEEEREKKYKKAMRIVELFEEYVNKLQMEKIKELEKYQRLWEQLKERAKSRKWNLAGDDFSDIMEAMEHE